jgi:hypothetical protein
MIVLPKGESPWRCHPKASASKKNCLV